VPAVAKALAGCSLARRSGSEGGWSPSCPAACISCVGAHKGRPYATAPTGNRTTHDGGRTTRKPLRFSSVICPPSSVIRNDITAGRCRSCGRNRCSRALSDCKEPDSRMPR